MQSHKLSQQELQQLLETVDVLRLLTARGQQEMRHVAPYLIGWGLYGVLNQVLQLVLHRAFWAEGMFLAFAIATGLLFGVFPTVLYWVGAAVLGIGSLYLFAQQPALVFVVFAVAIFAAMLLSYTTAARQGRLAEMPFRVSLAQKLGVLWGALVVGSWLFVLAVARGEPAVSGMWFSAFWAFVVGIGLMATGFLAPPLLWLGILQVLGSALGLYLRSWAVLQGVWLVLALGMFLVGLLYWVRRPEALGSVQPTT
jgi:hypothetical protein